MPLAARIDDGDRRLQAVPPHLQVPVVERSWAQAHLFPALSESGCGDNAPDSFSRSFGGALLPARPQDPGSHVGWIRSAFPRGPAARDWRARRGLPRCSCFGSLLELTPIDLVTIAQQVPWSGIFGKRLYHLLSCPPCRRVLGHVEMNDAPAMMSQDHKHEQHPKADGRHREEVDRDQISHMVVQESPPGLGRGLPVLGY